MNKHILIIIAAAMLVQPLTTSFLYWSLDRQSYNDAITTIQNVMILRLPAALYGIAPDHEYETNNETYLVDEYLYRIVHKRVVNNELQLHLIKDTKANCYKKLYESLLKKLSPTSKDTEGSNTISLFDITAKYVKSLEQYPVFDIQIASYNSRLKTPLYVMQWSSTDQDIVSPPPKCS